ncbi:hypothetical protein TCON_1211 [Astathelohania contejeani]|uniref:HECT domain-containing protein n=1 Tax=Astathelohania contejeani TaxID=164912 RepID=A0ABQ7HZI8_9MICR|nr:hypothetical protein TCON_1211 [Thelohania contejeani]
MNALCTMKKKTIALKKNETISNHNWFDAFYEKINDEVSINLIIDQNNMLDDIINKFKELALNNETYVTKKIQLFSNPKNHSIFLYNTKEIIIDLSLKLLKKENLLFHCIDEEKKIYEPYIFDFDLINNCVYDKFKLIGRFIGLTIKNRIFIPFKLSDYFIKLLYGKNITGNDIYLKDHFYQRILKIKKNF